MLPFAFVSKQVLVRNHYFVMPYSTILSRLRHSRSRLRYQNKSTRVRNPASYAGYVIKMRVIGKFIVMQIKLIFIRKVLHKDSFWNRGIRELENDLLKREDSDPDPTVHFAMVPIIIPYLHNQKQFPETIALTPVFSVNGFKTLQEFSACTNLMFVTQKGQSFV